MTVDLEMLGLSPAQWVDLDLEVHLDLVMAGLSLPAQSTTSLRLVELMACERGNCQAHLSVITNIKHRFIAIIQRIQTMMNWACHHITWENFQNN